MGGGEASFCRASKKTGREQPVLFRWGHVLAPSPLFVLHAHRGFRMCPPLFHTRPPCPRLPRAHVPSGSMVLTSSLILQTATSTSYWSPSWLTKCTTLPDSVPLASSLIVAGWGGCWGGGLAVVWCGGCGGRAWGGEEGCRECKRWRRGERREVSPQAKKPGGGEAWERGRLLAIWAVCVGGAEAVCAPASGVFPSQPRPSLCFE